MSTCLSRAASAALLAVWSLAVTCPPAAAQEEEDGIITNFVLVDAENNRDLQVLFDGQTLDLSELTTDKLNIRAEVTREDVASVTFRLNGIRRYRYETARPFALAGDAGGNYNAWRPRIGELFVEATPTMRGGKEAPPQSLRLQVVHSDAQRTRAPVSKEPQRPVSTESVKHQERSYRAELELVGHELPVGECFGRLSEGSGSMNLRCTHFLKRVARVELTHSAEQPGGRDSVVCSLRMQEDSFFADCPLKRDEAASTSMMVLVYGSTAADPSARGDLLRLSTN